MPRKTTKKSRTTTSEKHFTTVPKSVKPAAVIAAKPAEVVTPTVAVAVAETKPEVKAVVADLTPLLAQLRDLDADVAREAATALGVSANPAAVEPLIEIVSNTNGYFHSVVRSAAATGLGNLKDARAFDALINAVNDPITDPSSEAIRALARLGDARAVEVLVNVVRNESGFYAGSVRRAAVWGLSQLGGEVAQAALREVAGNPLEDTVIREEAVAGVKAK